MKVAQILCLFAMSAFVECTLVSQEFNTLKSETKDRTITRVVKMLQGMLDKSKADGDEERVLYAKYKCYCDTQEEEKKKSIEDLTKQIELLKSEIDQLKGSNGEDSTACADLKAAMAENEQARGEAEALRNKEHEEFLATKEDLEGAIGQMEQAIEVLAAVGADQTLSVGEDHKKFMAGYKGSLITLKAKVQDALIAASALMTPMQQKSVQSFIQAPFTGNYASQSGEIVGILKNMLDTFKANLAEAISTEAAQLKAYNAFMAEQAAAFQKMSDAYNAKQEKMGSTDTALADAKTSLETAKLQKASDEEFLALLIPMCEEKTKQYEKRKVLRANEEAAISEAIAILNSDAAFATFGKVDATSTGGTGPSFVQVSSRQLKIQAHSITERAKKILRKVNSPRVAKVIALLEADNPFTVVLEEIDKMIVLIEEEGKGDKENLDWCNSEREAQNAALEKAKQEIEALTGEINTLTDKIENPETGLKVLIANDEESLEENRQSQTTETESRQEENKAYQADIANLVEAEELLKGAISVLKKYYAKMEAENAGTGLLQKKEEPAPPETWEGEYSGQSEQGGSAIEMLEYILSETKVEEETAHSDEMEAQHSYEDSMQTLKDEEATLMKNLAELRETLAATEKELGEKIEEKKKTEAQKAAIEKYLLEIKPGCDFITENFDLRESHRATETEALKTAKTLLMDTPAYKAAVAEAHQESLGECKEKCSDEDQVVCKACLAKVSIPGYCAGHPDTAGCDTYGAPAPAAAA